MEDADQFLKHGSTFLAQQGPPLRLDGVALLLRLGKFTVFHEWKSGLQFAQRHAGPPCACDSHHILQVIRGTRGPRVRRTLNTDEKEAILFS